MSSSSAVIRIKMSSEPKYRELILICQYFKVHRGNKVKQCLVTLNQKGIHWDIKDGILNVKNDDKAMIINRLTREVKYIENKHGTDAIDLVSNDLTGDITSNESCDFVINDNNPSSVQVIDKKDSDVHQDNSANKFESNHGSSYMHQEQLELTSCDDTDDYCYDHAESDKNYFVKSDASKYDDYIPVDLNWLKIELINQEKREREMQPEQITTYYFSDYFTETGQKKIDVTCESSGKVIKIDESSATEHGGINDIHLTDTTNKESNGNMNETLLNANEYEAMDVDYENVNDEVYTEMIKDSENDSPNMIEIKHKTYSRQTKKNKKKFSYEFNDVNCYGDVFVDGTELKSNFIKKENIQHKQFRCTYGLCEKSYDMKRSLTEHIAAAHFNIMQKCTYENCTAEYSTKSGLRYHIQSVHENILWDCNYCGKSFTYNSNLLRHIKIDHENFHFHCLLEGCGQKFTRQANLNRHTWNHSRPDSYTNKVPDLFYYDVLGSRVESEVARALSAKALMRNCNLKFRLPDLFFYFDGNEITCKELQLDTDKYASCLFYIERDEIHKVVGQFEGRFLVSGVEDQYEFIVNQLRLCKDPDGPCCTHLKCDLDDGITFNYLKTHIVIATAAPWITEICKFICNHYACVTNRNKRKPAFKIKFNPVAESLLRDKVPSYRASHF